VINAEPSTSNGYLCWEQVQNATYEVLIFERHIDSLSNVTYDTLVTLYPSQNYLRFDAQYLNSNSYYYKINALNSLGEVEDESDFEPHCLYCPEDDEYIDACSWTCNGPDYAWKVTLAQNEAESNGRLMVSSGNTFDYDAGVSVPLYEPMTWTVYNAKGYPGYLDGRAVYTRNDVLAAEGIRDASNNLLSAAVHGNIYFVEKKLEQFWELPPIYTDVISISEANCGIGNRPWAINTYNNYPSSTLPIELTCTNAFGNYPDDPNDDENDGTNPNWEWWETINQYWGFEAPTIGDLLNGLPGLAANGQSWVRVNEVDEDFSFIYISRIDDVSFTPVIIDPATIFNNGGNFVAPSNNFSSGLYRVTFGWENGSVLPLVFEHDSAGYTPITNADFVELGIAPNPIQNNELKIEISTERQMNFTLQVLSLSGATLHTEQISMNADTTQQKNISVAGSNFPYSQLVVKLIFADGSTMQEIAIRP